MMIPIRPTFSQYLLLGYLLFCGSFDAAASEFEEKLHAASQPLRENGYGTAPLLEAASKARVVLLGEASHGTHEFYVWRSRLSQGLIEAGHVAFIAIEGDSASLAALDRYVRHTPGAPVSARAALVDITHWPSWIWANVELADFAEWLREFNRQQPFPKRVAIHGLDLYAISSALTAVEEFYRQYAPSVGTQARQLQLLFSPFRGRTSAYADAVMTSGQSLRPYALAIVDDLVDRYRRSSPEHREITFLALQQARAAAAGLAYLEALPHPPLLSANLRSRHFGLTLNRLLAHYDDGARGIVWAHNTHVGDARGINRRFVQERSLGQQARQAYGKQEVYIIGFGTGTGEVLAAKRWGGPCEVFSIPEPRPGSLEAAMLAAGGHGRFWLLTPGESGAPLLAHWFPHRAIGSTYDPAHDASQNYVLTRATARYDAFVFLPHTLPLQALDWVSGLPRCNRGRTK